MLIATLSRERIATIIIYKIFNFAPESFLSLIYLLRRYFREGKII
jgi:hypothetical protein